MLLAAGAGAARAELDDTAEYGGLLEFVCGADPDRCLDREPPLTDSDLLRFCAQDEARCRVWVELLARSGAVDADIDGVLDGADACPGTPTPVARAQSILLAQQLALTEVGEVLIEFRNIVIVASNGTLGSVERYRLGEDAVASFYELVSIGNKKVAGRYLFGGVRDDVPPFVLSGNFGPEEHPVLTYQGDHQPLSLPVGRSGELVPISIPGSRLFSADLDGDGSFPDDRGIDLFRTLIDAIEALHANDVEPLFEILSIVDEAVGLQVAELQRRNSATYSAVRRPFPRRELSGVDPSGCSQEQFCAAVGIARPNDAAACFASDFLNDEPLQRAPRDCRVEGGREAEPQCGAWRSPGRQR